MYTHLLIAETVFVCNSFRVIFFCATFSRFVSHPLLQRQLTASSFTCAPLVLRPFWLWHNFSWSILFRFAFIFFFLVLLLLSLRCWALCVSCCYRAFATHSLERWRLSAVHLATYLQTCICICMCLGVRVCVGVCVHMVNCNACAREFVDCIRACCWQFDVSTFVHIPLICLSVQCANAPPSLHASAAPAKPPSAVRCANNNDSVVYCEHSSA